MTKAVAGLAIAVALIGSAVGRLSAQEVQRRVSEPTPLEASDPRALRAEGLVKLLLAGEKANAVALVTKEADAGYAKSGTIEQDVDTQIKRLAGGNYRIKAFEQGFGADVVVFLVNDKKEETNLIVRYNAERKITGFAQAKIVRD